MRGCCALKGGSCFSSMFFRDATLQRAAFRAIRAPALKYPLAVMSPDTNCDRIWPKNLSMWISDSPLPPRQQSHDAGLWAHRRTTVNAMYCKFRLVCGANWVLELGTPNCCDFSVAISCHRSHAKNPHKATSHLWDNVMMLLLLTAGAWDPCKWNSRCVLGWNSSGCK